MRTNFNYMTCPSCGRRISVGDAEAPYAAIDRHMPHCPAIAHTKSPRRRINHGGYTMETWRHKQELDARIKAMMERHKRTAKMIRLAKGFKSHGVQSTISKIITARKNARRIGGPAGCRRIKK